MAVSNVGIQCGPLFSSIPPDLYGNDEVEAEQPLEENDAHFEETEEAHASEIAPASEVSSKPPAAVQEKSFANGVSHIVSNGSTASPIQSYTQQQAPQKIPTYEQPQPSDYQVSAPRSDGGYQNIPVNERSIRPSEMKDEG